VQLDALHLPYYTPAITVDTKAPGVEWPASQTFGSSESHDTQCKELVRAVLRRASMCRARHGQLTSSRQEPDAVTEIPLRFYG
jgi:hypothetical protein